jgi:transcriptional regulator with XRE-family HTH domain
MSGFRLTLKPWNDLQRQCFRYMAAERLNVAAFSRRAGVNPNTFRSWLRNKGSSTSSASLAALASVLGIPEELALEKAGGVTAEEKRRAVVERMVEVTASRGQGAPWQLAHRPEPRRRAAEKMRGRPRSEATKQKLRDKIIESGRAAQAGERMRARHKTPRGALVQQLPIFLRWHPEPTRAEVEQYAERVAARKGATREMVLAAWRPLLERHWPEVWNIGGRKLMEDRHRLLEN